ncbi:AAA family ATPase [Phytohabitans aurantiacus]|uniref:ATPase AAA-type core domain-containing protein n=1 Tax=Phytohabitans aurantiacus TaxID=3016789 RepID=A0ABQ5QYT7_9ACTN|nr:ATP-binding protein [Phytohabitans aurantiacus]GLH99202.1 hypothetical protein Pa4123_44770 [Phytohabitans aurantiacus]
MLRSFRVENHKSIRDEQELSLLPAYDKARPVVSVAAVFGANASGKSNLLDALRWLQSAVLTSYAGWLSGSGVPRTPFRLDPETAARVSGYAVDLVVDGIRYSYGVEADDERVRAEWLYTYPHNRRRAIFERDDNGIRLGSTVPDYRTRAEPLARQTRDNALFLSVAAQNDLAEAEPVFQWFRKGIAFGDAERINQLEMIRRLEDERERRSIVALIRAADLGIADVGVTDLAAYLTPGTTSPADAEAQLTNALVKLLEERAPHIAAAAHGRGHMSNLDIVFPRQLVFRHGRSEVPLGVQDQSAGTRSWIALMSHALDALDNGGLLLIDEVDASLHPHLSARLINLFRDAETNSRGGQLVFTTHDATLLDDETLSRDEVWFVEKEADTGATRLYPLTDFHPRKQENTEGRYLAGGYGAIPVLSDFDFREAVLRRQDSDATA